MRLASAFFTGFLCAALMGCGSNGDIKEALGLTREGPDEYRVVPRPPLSVPPEFNLRPPGEQESNYVSGKAAQVRAHEGVLGVNTATVGSADTAVTPVTSGDLPNGSDAQFLANAGATKADPHIRQKILDDKMNGIAEKDPDYLFGGKTESDSIVDAEKEKDRLKTNKAQNKSASEGETPVIKPKSKGLLGDIF